MRIEFRQGLVRAPGGFLQRTGDGVSLIVPPNDTVIITLADGNTDYLISEKHTISNAWAGPFIAGIDYYLYWDINLVTGQRKFGYTTVEPQQGYHAPSHPAADTHWYDMNTNQMKVYNTVTGRWTRVIRCFAASMPGGGNTFVSLSNNQTSFVGTTVGVTTTTSAGALLYDNLGGVLKKKDGTYFTTEDHALTGVAQSSQVKVGSVQLRAVAETAIPALTVVRFTNFNKIVPNTTHLIDKVVYGVVEFDAAAGEVANVTMEGVIRNGAWDWSSAGINTAVYVDVAGRLTTTPSTPPIPIGAIVDRDAILLRPAALFFGELGGAAANIGFTGSQGQLGPRGYTGSKGDTGAGFKISKVYASVADLTNDANPQNINIGEFAIVNTADINDPDNSRLYVWTDTGYVYTTDLSGAAGLTGPTGATGSTGFTGSKGDQGNTGFTGSTGPSGFTGSASTVAGPTGFTGSQGTQGAAGADGADGATGFTGSRGDVGFTGSQGVQGTIGDTGPIGFTGSASTVAGPVGFTGSQGVAGADGADGATGFTGSQGVQGVAGSDGATGFTGSQGATGFTGSSGTDGTSVLLKGSVPTYGSLPGTGNTIGDLYITSDTGTGYSWTDTGWANVGPIRGPQGAVGFTGSAGTDGAVGFTGSAGTNGGAGATGFTGSQGIQGDIGFTGSQGVGFTGSAGTNGTPGVIGFTGSQGIQGDIGFTGSQGVGYTGSASTVAGPAGFTGSAGADGATGFTGSQGVQGDIGFTGSQGVGYTGSAGAAGTSVVYRKTTISNNGVTAYVHMVADGSQPALDAVTLTTSGSDITLDNVAPGLVIRSVSISYGASFNSGTAFALKYPEPFGNTNGYDMPIPLVFMFNDASPSVMQGTTVQNYSISGGVVTVQKTGLVSNAAWRWRFVLL